MLKKNRRDLSVFLLLLLCLFAVADSYATKRYWVGTGSNKNWNSTTNWSATSGGASGASVPSTTDSAYFNGSGTGQCSINVSMNVRRLEIAAGYTDTIKQATGVGVAFGTGGAVLSGGYFIGSNGAITDQGIFTLSGTNFKSTTGRLTIQGNFTVTSGTFTHNNGEVFFTGIFSVSASITLYDCRFYPLSGVGGTFTLDSTATLNVSHLLTVSGAYLSTGKVHAQGDLVQDGVNISSYITNNGTIVIDGTGNQTFTGNSGYGVGAICNVEINKPSGTLYLKNYIVLYGKWKLTAGTIDVTTYTNYLSFAYGACSIEGTQTISNLIIYPYSTATVTLAVKSGDTLTVTGDMTAYGAASSTGSHTGAIKLLGNYNASSVSTSVNNGGTGTLIFCGTGTQNITGGSTQLASGMANVTVNKPSGTLYLKNTITFNKDWTHISGTVDADTYTSTVMFPGNPARTITGKTSFYNLTFHATTNNVTTINTGDSITVNNELKYTGTFPIVQYGGVMKVKGDITLSSTSITGIGTTVWHICGTGNQVFTGTTVNQSRVPSIKIDKASGTLTLKNAITVIGHWYYVRGTIDASTYSAMVVFGPGTHTLQGSHSLYNVQLYASTAASIVTINSGDSLTVNGELKLSGTLNATVNTGVINVKGDLTITNTSTGNAAGTGIFNICGTGSQTLTGSNISNGGQLSHVHVRKPSGTLYLALMTTVGAADWLYYSGNVDPGISSTVAFFGNGNVNCKNGSASMPFYNFSVISGTRTLTGLLRAQGTITITASRVLNGNGQRIQLGGNWNNSGSFTYAGSLLILNGKGPQRIIKSSGTETFDSVYVNRGKGIIYLNNPVACSKFLGFNQGIIATTATNYISMPDNAVITAGSDSSYICGPVRKTGNDAFVFPLGDTTITEGAYHPLSITAPASVTDSYSASYSNGVLEGMDSVDVDELSGVASCESYTLKRLSGTSTVTPTIGWNLNSCITDFPEDLRVVYWTGTNWKSLGAGTKVSGGARGTLTAVTGFSTATLTLSFGTAVIKPVSMVSCSNDINRNWASSRSFDGNGNVISESRSYSDYLGKTTQTQTRLITENNILATQTVYDAFGRGVIQTLPAPVNQTDFCYKTDFITNTSGTEYNYTDFDIPNHTTSTTTIAPGEVNKPKSVGNSSAGTLGWYYSNNNSAEPYVAASGLPYNRVEYDDSNGGVIKMKASAGESLAMGSGHESYYITMPVAGELKYLYGFANGWEIESETGLVEDPESIESYLISNFQPEIKAIKTISTDQNGVETVTISDSDGKLLASCLSGSVNDENVQVQHVASVIKPGVKGEDFVDIHLPKGCEGSLNIMNSSVTGLVKTYNIFNLKTEEYVKFSGSIDFTGATPNLEPGYYRIIYKSGPTVSELYVKHDLNYYNFSINYYDKAGRLKMSIPPAGVDIEYSPSVSTISNSAAKAFKYVAAPSGTDPYWSLNTTSSFDNHISAAITLPVSPEVQVTSIKAQVSRNTAVVHAESVGPRSMSVDYLSSTLSPQSIEIGDDFGITDPIPDPPDPIDGSSVIVNNYEITFDIKNQAGYVVASGLKVNGKHYFIYGGLAGLTDDYWRFDNPETAIVYPVPSNTTSQVIAEITDVKKTRYVVGGINMGIQPLDAELDQLRFTIFTHTEKLPAIPAHKMPVEYDYNSQNLLLSYRTPDQGKTESVYEKDGRIRFTQNEKQRASSINPYLRKFSYTNYDAQNRITETGEFTPVNAVDAGNLFFENYYDYNPAATYSGTQSIHAFMAAGGTIDPAKCTDRNQVMYDFPDADFYTLTGLSPASYKQNLTLYKVSKTWNNNKSTWYSYDERGRMSWMVQRIEDLPSTGSYKIVTVNYVYDFNGNVKEVQYNKEQSSESFYHYYTYDADNRLLKVYTNTDGSAIKQEQANYYYYKHGALKRTEIAGKAQGLDYVYTINGWLKSFNSPELNERDPGNDGTSTSPHHVPADLFAFTLDYFNGDYLRGGTNIQTFGDPAKNSLAPDQYNGLVKDARWQTKVPGAGTGLSYTGSQLMYAYNYDKKYQLTNATFGAITNNGTLNPVPGEELPHDYYGPIVNEGNDYKVSGITYDLQGNIKALNRNAYAAGPALNMDQMTYDYIPATNKLVSVADAVTTNNYSNLDFKTGQSSSNYVYDALGQLLADASENNYYNYDAYGKVTEVYSDASRTVPKVKFLYDQAGQRIKKTSYDGSGTLTGETWYMLDAAGHQLSVYEKPVGAALAQVETGIFTSGRIGVYHPAAKQSTYELSDQLGNVRTTFSMNADYSLASGFEGTGEDDRFFNFNATTDNTFYRGVSGSSVKVDNINPMGAMITVPVTTGQVVTTTVYTYFALTGTPANARLVYELKNSTGTVVNTQSTSIPLTAGSWQLLTAIYTVPSASAGYTLTIYPLWQGANPQPVWFDDITILLTPNSDNIGILKPEQLSLTDYYPHGGSMPGRNYLGTNNYRYGYQGQYSEKDPETNLNNFELRMWDARLGRWLTPDPLGQYFSPYMGMGNNPVSNFDPTGGYAPPNGYGFDVNTNQIYQIDKTGGNEFDVYFYGNHNSDGSFTINSSAGFFTVELALVYKGRLNEGASKLTPYDPTYWDREFQYVENNRIDIPNKIALNLLNQTYIAYNWIVNRSMEDLRGENVGYEGAKSAALFTEISILTAPLGFAGEGAGIAANEGVIENSVAESNIDDLVRVRHHTSNTGAKAIKNNGSINASRGVPYGVDVEVQPFLKPSKVNMGQFGRGSYVEFSVPQGQIAPIPGYMGGTGNAGRIITGGAPLNIQNANPIFVRNWWNF